MSFKLHPRYLFWSLLGEPQIHDEHFLDIPLEIMDKGTGMSRQIKPWNVDCLQAFKQEYNVDHLSALIIDGISMAKHWMLTYLDEHLKEAKLYDTCNVH